MNNLGRILLVEDDPKDVELTLMALEEYNLVNEVVVAGDGAEALDYLYCRGKFAERTGENPAVLLLDLKLPKVDGLEVLQQIKSDRETEDDSGGRPHLVARGKRYGGELQARRERLCGKTSGLPRVCQCHQGTRGLLGSYQ